MHIERLRQARASLSISAPKKPKHMQQNLKKELLNLCTVTKNHLFFRTNERNPIPKPNSSKKNAANRRIVLAEESTCAREAIGKSTSIEPL
jgi:hypothetical protein